MDNNGIVQLIDEVNDNTVVVEEEILVIADNNNNNNGKLGNKVQGQCRNNNNNPIDVVNHHHHIHNNNNSNQESREDLASIRSTNNNNNNNENIDDNDDDNMIFFISHPIEKNWSCLLCNVHDITNVHDHINNNTIHISLVKSVQTNATNPFLNFPTLQYNPKYGFHCIPYIWTTCRLVSNNSITITTTTTTCGNNNNTKHQTSITCIAHTWRQQQQQQQKQKQIGGTTKDDSCYYCGPTSSSSTDYFALWSTGRIQYHHYYPPVPSYIPSDESSTSPHHKKLRNNVACLQEINTSWSCDICNIHHISSKQFWLHCLTEEHKIAELKQHYQHKQQKKSMYYSKNSSNNNIIKENVKLKLLEQQSKSLSKEFVYVRGSCNNDCQDYDDDAYTSTRKDSNITESTDTATTICVVDEQELAETTNTTKITPFNTSIDDSIKIVTNNFVDNIATTTIDNDQMVPVVQGQHESLKSLLKEQVVSQPTNSSAVTQQAVVHDDTNTKNQANNTTQVVNNHDIVLQKKELSSYLEQKKLHHDYTSANSLSSSDIVLVDLNVKKNVDLRDHASIKGKDIILETTIDTTAAATTTTTCVVAQEIVQNDTNITNNTNALTADNYYYNVEEEEESLLYLEQKSQPDDNTNNNISEISNFNNNNNNNLDSDHSQDDTSKAKDGIMETTDTTTITKTVSVIAQEAAEEDKKNTNLSVVAKEAVVQDDTNTTKKANTTTQVVNNHEIVQKELSSYLKQKKLHPDSSAKPSSSDIIVDLNVKNVDNSNLRDDSTSKGKDIILETIDTTTITTTCVVTEEVVQNNTKMTTNTNTLADDNYDNVKEEESLLFLEQKSQPDDNTNILDISNFNNNVDFDHSQDDTSKGKDGIMETTDTTTTTVSVIAQEVAEEDKNTLLVQSIEATNTSTMAAENQVIDNREVLFFKQQSKFENSSDNVEFSFHMDSDCQGDAVKGKEGGIPQETIDITTTMIFNSEDAVEEDTNTRLVQSTETLNMSTLVAKNLVDKNHLIDHEEALFFEQQSHQSDSTNLSDNVEFSIKVDSDRQDDGSKGKERIMEETSDTITMIVDAVGEDANTLLVQSAEKTTSALNMVSEDHQIVKGGSLLSTQSQSAKSLEIVELSNNVDDRQNHNDASKGRDCIIDSTDTRPCVAEAIQEDTPINVDHHHTIPSRLLNISDHNLNDLIDIQRLSSEHGDEGQSKNEECADYETSSTGKEVFDKGPLYAEYSADVESCKSLQDLKRLDENESYGKIIELEKREDDTASVSHEDLFREENKDMESSTSNESNTDNAVELNSTPGVDFEADTKKNEFEQIQTLGWKEPLVHDPTKETHGQSAISSSDDNDDDFEKSISNSHQGDTLVASPAVYCTDAEGSCGDVEQKDFLFSQSVTSDSTDSPTDDTKSVSVTDHLSVPSKRDDPSDKRIVSNDKNEEQVDKLVSFMHNCADDTVLEEAPVGIFPDPKVMNTCDVLESKASPSAPFNHRNSDNVVEVEQKTNVENEASASEEDVVEKQSDEDEPALRHGSDDPIVSEGMKGIVSEPNFMKGSNVESNIKPDTYSHHNTDGDLDQVNKNDAFHISFVDAFEKPTNSNDASSNLIRDTPADISNESNEDKEEYFNGATSIVSGKANDLFETKRHFGVVIHHAPLGGSNAFESNVLPDSGFNQPIEVDFDQVNESSDVDTNYVDAFDSFGEISQSGSTSLLGGNQSKDQLKESPRCDFPDADYRTSSSMKCGNEHGLIDDYKYTIDGTSNTEETTDFSFEGDANGNFKFISSDSVARVDCEEKVTNEQKAAGIATSVHTELASHSKSNVQFFVSKADTSAKKNDAVVCSPHTSVVERNVCENDFASHLDEIQIKFEVSEEPE